MKAVRISNQFKKGHTYFSQTRAGKIRKFEVERVLMNTTTKEHVAVVARYDGKAAQRYWIKKNSLTGNEYIIVDERFCTVIDTLELVDDVEITDDMISEVHEFNNCGNCTVTVNGQRFSASWNHGEVTADDSIREAFRAYIYG
jgi:hypothetical protein